MRGISGFVNFGDFNKFKLDTTVWYSVFFYKYFYIIAMLMIGIHIIIQFCYIRENHLKRKSYLIPFCNIFALLNGSTKDFFMRNKLKLNEEYFKIMMLLISRYDKYLKDCIYTDKSTKWNKILKIYTFFSGFSGFVFLRLMYEEYYISIIIFTIINCIFVFISFFIIYKVGNNKLTIPNYKSTELLHEWWLFNRELPDENYFHTKYSNFFINFNNKNGKFFLKDKEFKNKRMKIELNINNYDKKIFTSLDDYKNFLLILPLDKLYKSKKEKDPLWK